jgi:hypothetical protein
LSRYGIESKLCKKTDFTSKGISSFRKHSFATN